MFAQPEEEQAFLLASGVDKEQDEQPDSMTANWLKFAAIQDDRAGLACVSNCSGIVERFSHRSLLFVAAFCCCR